MDKFLAFMTLIAFSLLSAACSGPAAQITGADVHLQKGRQQAAEEDYDAAIASFTEAIRLRPGSAELYFARGMAHIEKQNWKAAANDFTKVIEFEPDNPTAHFQKGVAIGKQGDMDGAIENLTRAVALTTQCII